MNNLEQFYKGDQNWIDFSSSFDEHWNGKKEQSELLNKCQGQQDFAKVIHFHLGKNAIKWMSASIEALDNLAPENCFKDEKLNQRLKVFLTRFPV